MQLVNRFIHKKETVFAVDYDLIAAGISASELRGYTPNAFKLHGSIRAKYQGVGVAVASIFGGQVVDLVYVHDVFAGIDWLDEDEDKLKTLLDDPRLEPTVRRLQATGEVSIGFCEGYKFAEL